MKRLEPGSRASGGRSLRASRSFASDSNDAHGAGDDGRDELLRFARRIAVRCARIDPHSYCTIDDVRERLMRAGHASGVLNGLGGSLFRTASWVATRFRVRSRRRECHGRELVVWRLVGEGSPRSSRPPWTEWSLLVPDRASLRTLGSLLLDVKRPTSEVNPR